jgi:hypothetical protein
MAPPGRYLVVLKSLRGVGSSSCGTALISSVTQHEQRTLTCAVFETAREIVGARRVALVGRLADGDTRHTCQQKKNHEDKHACIC